MKKRIILNFLLNFSFGNMSFLIAIAIIVTIIIEGAINYSLVAAIIAFASFIATSFFSISIFNHNAVNA